MFRDSFSFSAFSLAWNFFRDVLRWIVKSPRRVLPQMCVKPRKSNVSGLAFTAFGSPFLCVAPELDQPRLLRVQLQAELGKPFPQLGQTASGVGFLAEPDHKVVGVAHDDDLALGVAFPPFVDPEVQHVVQEHVRIER